MERNEVSDISYMKGKKTLIVLLLLACFAQGCVIYFLFIQHWYFASIFHIITACLFPYPLWKLMPEQFHNSKLILILLFTLCLLIPLVSGPSLFFSLTDNIYHPKPFLEDITDTVEAAKLPENLLHIMQLSQYAGGSLRSILETSLTEELRIKAVLKTRQMPDYDAVPILRTALLDSNDEVRLLAYSMLDKKEKVIDRVIYTQLQILENNPDGENILVHSKLAESYWEMSYLGLVHGQARVHILQDAYKHIQTVLKYRADDGELHFLKAKVALALNLYDVVEKSLRDALSLGIPAARIGAYQAELAFVTQRFDEITNYISTVDDLANDNELVLGMLKQWS